MHSYDIEAKDAGQSETYVVCLAAMKPFEKHGPLEPPCSSAKSGERGETTFCCPVCLTEAVDESSSPIVLTTASVRYGFLVQLYIGPSNNNYTGPTRKHLSLCFLWRHLGSSHSTAAFRRLTIFVLYESPGQQIY
jgi:hypothetical protein